MPGKTSLLQMREWLESYERGKSQISIAKHAHRDVRTIQKGIDRVRRERDLQLARGELLTEALRKHQSGLLSMFEQALSEVSLPAYDSPAVAWPWDSHVTSQQEADRSEGKVNVTLGPESKTEWALLQEHLRRDPIWKVIDQWKKLLSAHLGKKASVQRLVVELLEQRTGYKLVRDGSAPKPHLVGRTLAPTLYEAVMREAFGERRKENFESMLATNPAAGEVVFRRGAILARVPGVEEECLKKIVEVSRLLMESNEVGQAVNTYRTVEGLRPKVKRTIEEVLLLGLIPGQCHVCRRLGL